MSVERPPTETTPEGAMPIGAQRGLVIFLSALAIYLVFEMVGGCGRTPTIEIERADQKKLEFRLDLNTANWTDLVQLPGVGKGLAERIVREREVNGPFRSIDDLRRVKGIGEGVMREIRPFVEVRR